LLNPLVCIWSNFYFVHLPDTGKYQSPNCWKQFLASYLFQNSELLKTDNADKKAMGVTDESEGKNL